MIPFIDKLYHFNHETTVERNLHAKGTGAFGTFVPYQSMKDFTCANFLSSVDIQTKVFVRFSTMNGKRGSADTVRDFRGFATKFYTNNGVYDLLCGHTPVYYLNNPYHIPDLIHSMRPAPNQNFIDVEHFWDFASLTPELLHMITWLYSDYGTLRSYSSMNGYGITPYIWRNSSGDAFFVNYKWKSMQGIKNITHKEAYLLAGTHPNICCEQLFYDIEQGIYPRYELDVQIISIKDLENLTFDPLDVTKIWDEEKFPYYQVGIMTLTENPTNYYAQVEHSAFSPCNLINGIELAPTKIMEAQQFCYEDAQTHRLGSNFTQMTVNKSYHYSPSIFSTNNTAEEESTIPLIDIYNQHFPIETPDYFSQATARFQSLDQEAQLHLCENIANELQFCCNELIIKNMQNFTSVSPDMANQIFYLLKKLGK